MYTQNLTSRMLISFACFVVCWIFSKSIFTRNYFEVYTTRVSNSFGSDKTRYIVGPDLVQTVCKWQQTTNSVNSRHIIHWSASNSKSCWIANVKSKWFERIANVKSKWFEHPYGFLSKWVCCFFRLLKNWNIMDGKGVGIHVRIQRADRGSGLPPEKLQ